ncbi:MAG: hypothetical protein J7K26_03820 [Candidatus Aenigmarchaeota archaeon]|nr:hypothetical protein [Candidatus Aenigmarchaeota archaeon]
MRQFEVKVKNNIGDLANVTEAIAAAGVSLKAIATEERGDHGIIKFITDNEDLTREALKKAGHDFNEFEIIPAKLLDKPGELAKFSRILANLGINIQSIFLLDRNKGTVNIAFKVDNLAKAREILGQ